MSKTERTIRKTSLGVVEDGDYEGEEEFLIVALRYDKGGWNMFSGGNEGRGYYLSVTPVVEGVSASGIGFARFGLFSGIKTLIEPATRFSAKRLETIVPDEDVIGRLTFQVLAKRAAKQEGV